MNTCVGVEYDYLLSGGGGVNWLTGGGWKSEWAHWWMGEWVGRLEGGRLGG